MKNKPYIRAAILFIATLIIAFWGLNYLKGKNFFSSERTFYSVYDRIGGLTKSSPVTINGFQIGQVRKIELSPRNPSLIEVKFTISYAAVNIPKGTIARIYSVDLMGTKGIALDFSTAADYCQPEDALGGSVEGDLRDQVNAQMVPFKMKAESLMSSMDSLLTSIQTVFNQSNRDNLARCVYSVGQTLENLENASRFLKGGVKWGSPKGSSVLSKADSLALGIMKEIAEIQGIIRNLSKFSDTLATVPLTETFHSLGKVLYNLNTLSGQVAAGEGSLGKLIRDDSLYSSIITTTAELDRLIEDIRIRPGRYINLSLSDRSKNIYTAGDSELASILAGEGTSDYYIVLLQSPTEIFPNDPVLAGAKVENYIQVGSLYYYFTYQNPRIEPCLKRIEKVRKTHPSAGIFTWINGSWKRLNI